MDPLKKDKRQTMVYRNLNIEQHEPQ